MLQNVTRIKTTVGEKIFEFYCDNDSPIQTVKEALFQFIKIVVQIEENILNQQKTAAETKTEEEPIPIET